LFNSELNFDLSVVNLTGLEISESEQQIIYRRPAWFNVDAAGKTFSVTDA
jgi:hypothetical protein